MQVCRSHSLVAHGSREKSVLFCWTIGVELDTGYYQGLSISRSIQEEFKDHPMFIHYKLVQRLEIFILFSAKYIQFIIIIIMNDRPRTACEQCVKDRPRPPPPFERCVKDRP